LKLLFGLDLGKYYSGEGDRYEGEFKEGKFNGLGKKTNQIKLMDDFYLSFIYLPSLIREIFLE